MVARSRLALHCATDSDGLPGSRSAWNVAEQLVAMTNCYSADSKYRMAE